MLSEPSGGWHNDCPFPTDCTIAAGCSFLQMEQVSWVHSRRAKNSWLEGVAEHWSQTSKQRFPGCSSNQSSWNYNTWLILSQGDSKTQIFPKSFFKHSKWAKRKLPRQGQGANNSPSRARQMRHATCQAHEETPKKQQRDPWPCSHLIAIYLLWHSASPRHLIFLRIFKNHWLHLCVFRLRVLRLSVTH